MIPLKSDSAPIGTWILTGWCPSFSLSMSVIVMLNEVYNNIFFKKLPLPGLATSRRSAPPGGLMSQSVLLDRQPALRG